MWSGDVKVLEHDAHEFSWKTSEKYCIELIKLHTQYNSLRKKLDVQQSSVQTKYWTLENGAIRTDHKMKKNKIKMKTNKSRDEFRSFQFDSIHFDWIT